MAGYTDDGAFANFLDGDTGSTSMGDKEHVMLIPGQKLHSARPCRWLALAAGGLLFCLCGVGWGYEIGTLFNTGSAQVRGQSFVPSQTALAPLAVPFPSGFEPQDLAGQSYLYEIDVDFVDSAAAPSQLFVFAALPSAQASITGTGALAVGQIGQSCRDDRCSYRFAQTVALSHNDTYFLVFPSCAELVTGDDAGADDYPAGGVIQSTSCATPGSGSLNVDPGNSNVAFVARFYNASPNLVADYLAADQGSSRVANAPALAGQDFTQVTQETVRGRTATVLPMSGALTLDTQNLVSSSSYSLTMLLRVDETSAYRKLVDLSDLQSDNGLYAVNNSLEFFPAGAAMQPNFPPNTWLQLSLSRDPTGGVRILLDDQTEIFFDDFDTQLATLSPAQRLTLFVDDLVTGPTENPTGAWARIRLFENAGGDLSGLSALPDEGIDRFENDNGPFRADLGLNGAGGRFRTLHSREDEDWLYAGVTCDAPNGWNIRGAEGNLVLYSDDPRFQPLVEYYPQSALANPNVSPTLTAGACGNVQRLLLPAPSDTFIRIRNCPEVEVSPDNAIAYRVEDLAPDSQVCAAAILIQGTVTEAGTGTPVGGVFILGDDNSSGFANPADGSYKILVTDFTQMTLNVISPLWEATPQTLDAITDMIMAGDTLTVNFQVTRKGSLFKDSLEDSNPFELP